jgi:ectoine hydroxylase
MIIDPQQKTGYEERGFLVLPGLIDAETVARLSQLAYGFVAESGDVAETDKHYTLAPGHSRERPRIRALKHPDERHEAFWDLGKGTLADVAQGLLGPDVRFSHSKLNFKLSEGRDEFLMHQDVQFFPHTNFSPLTIGVYLADTTADLGAVRVLPGSHRGELYEHYDADGNWAGHMRAEDMATIDTSLGVPMEGPAGTVTVHNCRTVHWSPPSPAGDGRPFLAFIYAPADAFPYAEHPEGSSNRNTIVRGRATRWARHDPRPCQIPAWALS